VATGSVNLSFLLFVCFLWGIVETHYLLSVNDWFVEKKIAIFYSMEPLVYRFC